MSLEAFCASFGSYNLLLGNIKGTCSSFCCYLSCPLHSLSTVSTSVVFLSWAVSCKFYLHGKMNYFLYLSSYFMNLLPYKYYSRKMTKKHTFWFGFLTKMNLNSCFSNFNTWIFNINNILALFQTVAFIIYVHMCIYRVQFKSKYTSGFIGLHYFWYHNEMTFGKCHLKTDHCICCLIWTGR